jgi:hypothetical protein
MPTDPTPDLAAIRKRLEKRARDHHKLAFRESQQLASDLDATLAAFDAQAARLAAYRTALETIRDYDALDTPIRSGPCSIGDMSLAISRGLDHCQRVASAALKGAPDGQ